MFFTFFAGADDLVHKLSDKINVSSHKQLFAHLPLITVCIEVRLSRLFFTTSGRRMSDFIKFDIDSHKDTPKITEFFRLQFLTHSVYFVVFRQDSREVPVAGQAERRLPQGFPNRPCHHHVQTEPALQHGETQSLARSPRHRVGIHAASKQHGHRRISEISQSTSR